MNNHPSLLIGNRKMSNYMKSGNEGGKYVASSDDQSR